MNNILKDKKFFLSVASFTISFIISIFAEITESDWKENVFIILAFGIFIPFILYSKKMLIFILEMRGVKVITDPELGHDDNNVFSTNIFYNTKNIYLKYLLNFFGDLTINIIFCIIMFLFFIVSFAIAYYFTKALEIII